VLNLSKIRSSQVRVLHVLPDMTRLATPIAAIAMENAAHSNGPLISSNILYSPLARVLELGFHFIGPGFHLDGKPTQIVAVAVIAKLQEIRTA
jgi:hypothetical protein